MNVTQEFEGGVMRTTYNVKINDLISQKMEAYALLLLIISVFFVVYVLWNNFVRSPSKKRTLSSQINEFDLQKDLACDEGVEPSSKVKKISRALDEYIIIPALVMFYISLSYYLSI